MTNVFWLIKIVKRPDTLLRNRIFRSEVLSKIRLYRQSIQNWYQSNNKNSSTQTQCSTWFNSCMASQAMIFEIR